MEEKAAAKLPVKAEIMCGTGSRLLGFYSKLLHMLTMWSPASHFNLSVSLPFKREIKITSTSKLLGGGVSHTKYLE